MENLRRVYITEDGDGHPYVIPYELKEEFDSLMLNLFDLYNAGPDEDDDGKYWEELEALEGLIDEKFGKYATGGDINLVELYANID